MLTTPVMESKRSWYTGILVNCVSMQTLRSSAIGSEASIPIMSTRGVMISLTLFLSRFRTLVIISPSSVSTMPLFMAELKMRSSSSSET